MRKLNINTNTDTGKFRAALLLSGFFPQSESFIFNDKNQDNRRLKLWFAGAVSTAPKQQQDVLVGWLSYIFGECLIEHGWLNLEEQSMPDSFFIRLEL